MKLLAMGYRWLRDAPSQVLATPWWIQDLPSLEKQCASPSCLPCFLSGLSMKRACSHGEVM